MPAPTRLRVDLALGSHDGAAAIGQCVRVTDFEPLEFAAWFKVVTEGDSSVPPGLRPWMLRIFNSRGALSKSDFIDAYVREQVDLAKAAVERVLVDLRRTGAEAPRIEVDVYAESVRISVDGSWSTPSMTAHPWEPAEAQAEVADYLQEQLDYVWPVCDLDDTGLHAQVRDGEAMWWCSVGRHVLGRIGELGA